MGCFYSQFICLDQLCNGYFPAIALGLNLAEPGVMTSRLVAVSLASFLWWCHEFHHLSRLLQGALLVFMAGVIANPVHIGDKKRIMRMPWPWLLQLLVLFSSSTLQCETVYQSIFTVGPFKSKTFNWSILVSFILY